MKSKLLALLFLCFSIFGCDTIVDRRYSDLKILSQKSDLIVLALSCNSYMMKDSRSFLLQNGFHKISQESITSDDICVEVYQKN